MHIARIGIGSTEQPAAEVVGAKAANLARVAALGLPVPPAFVLPVELCAAMVSGDSKAKQQLADGLAEGIEWLENATGKLFGDRRRPLLVSVRAGAARSMPGMLDTILNVGCTSDAVHGLVRMTGHPRFAFDCRRRFLESYGGVVLGVDPAVFKARLDELIIGEGIDNERALDGEAVERLAASYQQAIDDENCRLVDTPMEQLRAAAEAVYRSWVSDRAVTYRKLEHLEELDGTAVAVQAMVFGNSGLSSGAGVAFSRDPSTGANTPVIDVMIDAQGEDVVSGRQTPETEEAIVRSLPAVAVQLRGTLTLLEQDFGDVQDVEFTIEDGKLWILQHARRSARRRPRCAFRSTSSRRDGPTPTEAPRRADEINPDARPRAGTGAHAGQPASAGTGGRRDRGWLRGLRLASAKRSTPAPIPSILRRPDTGTADVEGFAVSEGIVTAIGGRTAHAALVARQMGKPCIVGCAGLTIDVESHGAAPEARVERQIGSRSTARRERSTPAAAMSSPIVRRRSWRSSSAGRGPKSI